MSTDRNELYQLAYPAPQVDHQPEGTTLLVALKGYADSGGAIGLAADVLLSACNSFRLGFFNSDELIDFRSRRPTVVFENNQVSNIEQLEPRLDLLWDLSDRQFLLLSGAEPDFKWHTFAGAITDLAAKYHITKAIFLYAANMPVPHTRPQLITAHGNDTLALQQHLTADQRYAIPGSAQLFLESALSRAGVQVLGLTAHVPQYLATNQYPAASLALLRDVEQAAGIKLPVGTLKSDADEFAAALQEAYGQDSDLAQMLAHLEPAYDQHVAAMQQRRDRRQIAASMPSDQEISAEVEAFLKSLEAGGTDQQ